jgi:PAS domain S-box-containing protein
MTPDPRSGPDEPQASAMLGFVMDTARLAWWEMDCRTGAVRFDERKSRMLGFPADRFRHYQDFTALLHPEDCEPAMQAMRDHLAGKKETYAVRYRIRNAAGAYVWMQDLGGIRERDSSGKPLTVAGVVQDVSDQMRAEEALRASEGRLRALFHGHSAVKLVIDPETGRILDANDAAARFYGWSIDELRQMRIQQINALPPDEVARAMSAAGSSSNSRFEFRHRLADGSLRDVEVFSNRVQVGGTAMLYSIIHDISERNRMAAALTESESRYRMLAEHVSDVIWILDLDEKRYRYVSSTISNLRGYMAEEVIGQRLEESLTPRSLATLLEALPARIQHFLDGDTRSYTDLLEQPHKDGSLLWVEVHSRFLRNDRTGHLEVLGVSRDVTERRRTEEALRLVRERLEHAEAFARFGHWELSLDDEVMHASEGALRIYGLPPGPVPLSAVKDAALPELRPRLDRALRALIEEGQPYEQEFQIRRQSDGRVVDVMSRAELDRARRLVFGVVQDISARKQGERERENLILQLQSAIDHIRTLKGIVPICSHCKKIRDDKGFWEQVDAYVTRHTEAQFTHGICPDCLEKFYRET